MDCQDDLEWASLGGRPALAVEGKLVPLRLPSSSSSASSSSSSSPKYISEWLWAVFINSWKLFPLFGMTCPTRSEWWEFQLLPFGPPGGVLDRSPSNSSYGLIVPGSGFALLNPGFTQETKQQGGWKDLPPATRSCSALCLQPAVVLCPLFWFHILRSGDIDLWRTCIFRCFVYPATCK